MIAFCIILGAVILFLVLAFVDLFRWAAKRDREAKRKARERAARGEKECGIVMHMMTHSVLDTEDLRPMPKKMRWAIYLFTIGLCTPILIALVAVLTGHG
jgi:hypothetical protein